MGRRSGMPVMLITVHQQLLRVLIVLGRPLIDLLNRLDITAAQLRHLLSCVHLKGGRKLILGVMMLFIDRSLVAILTALVS